jgi:hypothetical protein
MSIQDAAGINGFEKDPEPPARRLPAPNDQRSGRYLVDSLAQQLEQGMIRRAQPNELHLIPVQQREVAHPGFTLFLFMAQPDNPALFWRQAPHRFTWHGAFSHLFTIPLHAPKTSIT